MTRPTLAEDLLLLAFQPRSGAVGGETTLYYVLGAAVLAELALDERVTATTSASGGVTVEAVAGRAPSDPILRAAWEHVVQRPRDVRSVLPAIGPPLRAPLLDRLVARGDIGRKRRRLLGPITTTALVDGGTGRRADLLAQVQDVLVAGADPTPRQAALAALLSASGVLPQLDPEIPWTSAVIARAQRLEQGSWPGAAGAEAVTRTVTTIVIGSAISVAVASRT